MASRLSRSGRCCTRWGPPQGHKTLHSAGFRERTAIFFNLGRDRELKHRTAQLGGASAPHKAGGEGASHVPVAV